MARQFRNKIKPIQKILFSPQTMLWKKTEQVIDIKNFSLYNYYEEYDVCIIGDDPLVTLLGIFSLMQSDVFRKFVICIQSNTISEKVRDMHAIRVNNITHELSSYIFNKLGVKNKSVGSLTTLLSTLVNLINGKVLNNEIVIHRLISTGLQLDYGFIRGRKNYFTLWPTHEEITSDSTNWASLFCISIGRFFPKKKHDQSSKNQFIFAKNIIYTSIVDNVSLADVAETKGVYLIGEAQGKFDINNGVLGAHERLYDIIGGMSLYEFIKDHKAYKIYCNTDIGEKNE
ncbi:MULTISPECIES: hypothetical protein [Cysteiniphilum]|uniref:Uncharacterized protein n=1 Tax=Cysteiniphilum litorale TaxID=2056700 RepID=A0A8J3E7F9_9GAMM|nr:MULTISPECIES: hypothetical protein [Cysteiniphilum]GGF91679.1 hypothetical protein GCM10010995_06100 [Cysteiniphilum litorale]